MEEEIEKLKAEVEMYKSQQGTIYRDMQMALELYAQTEKGMELFMSYSDQLEAALRRSKRRSLWLSIGILAIAVVTIFFAV